MKTTELISISALAISFLTFWLTYIRENRKKFQENLYDLKLDAYKNIIKEVWNFIEEAYNLNEEMQVFEGDKREWLAKFEKESSKYLDQAYELTVHSTENVLIFPENSIDKLNEIIRLSTSHVITAYHFDFEMMQESYNNLIESFNDFVNLARKELGTNKLNKSLNKRLARDFYPIGIRNSV